jgi:hypothetical protein
MPRSKMKPRITPSSVLAQTTATSEIGELVILQNQQKTESKMKKKRKKEMQ